MGDCLSSPDGVDAKTKALMREFKLFDKDRNGFITPEELKKAMARGGMEITDEEVNDMISKVDVNSDGKVNYEEFAKMMGAE
mmetsp:Transcript_67472/g.170209  ORF Transcript_67472/g.170209 Transcript_67472/m.170209 type:complete len:82 (-) Transcript_67472:84-329(-)